MYIAKPRGGTSVTSNTATYSADVLPVTINDIDLVTLLIGTTYRRSNSHSNALIDTCTGTGVPSGPVTDILSFIMGICTTPVYGRPNELYTIILNYKETVK